MGQKVNPVGIRLGITRDWMSKWYAGKKQFPSNVHTDFRVREFLATKLKDLAHGDELPIRIRSELPKTLLLKGKRFY